MCARARSDRRRSVSALESIVTAANDYQPLAEDLYGASGLRCPVSTIQCDCRSLPDPKRLHKTALMGSLFLNKT